MPIKGVLFDKDGTLLDFHATWYPVNRAVALAVAQGDESLAARLLIAGGYDPARDRFRSGSVLAAGNSIEIAEAFALEIGNHVPDNLVALIDGIMVEGGKKSTVAVPDMFPLLARLKKRGLKLGVATSDSEAGARGTLEPFRAVDLLDFIAGYDSGFGVKPGPGMALAFCQATGLRPSEIAVVGDNLHDMDMGRRAGAALLVGVLTGTSAREELVQHADQVLESIAQLEELLDELGLLALV